VGPRAGLDGSENLAPTGIRSPDLPARSESLYRLSCIGPEPLQAEHVMTLSNYEVILPSSLYISASKRFSALSDT
jgi:hypothetical protein